MITAESAKANSSNANLTREVAEIAVIEYQEGIAKQDEATLQGELRLAQSELRRAEESIQVLKKRSAKIEEVSKGSAADLDLEFNYEDRIAESERRVPKARLEVERVESKIKMQETYTKPIRIKKLQIAVANARADELGKKAIAEAETAKLKRLEAAVSKNEHHSPSKPLLLLVERAFSLDEKLRGHLAKAVTAEKNEASSKHSAELLVSELEAVVDQVEADLASAQFDRLKTSIHQGAEKNRGQSPGPAIDRGQMRDDPKLQISDSAGSAGFETTVVRRLKNCHERIVHLARPVLDLLSKQTNTDADAISEATRIEAAKAKLRSATLAREVAELEQKEFLDGTVKQEESMLKRELELAQDDLNEAMVARQKATAPFEKIKRLSKGTATDLQLEYNYEGRVTSAELGQRRAQFAIEMVNSKQTELPFTRNQRLNELRSRFHGARAQELGSQATLNLLEAKLRRIQGESKLKDIPPTEKRLLALLDETVSIDAAIRGKLELFTKNGRTDAGLQNEIRESTNRLESVIERAEMERAAARFDKLKDELHRPPARRSFFQSLFRDRSKNDKP
jgi:hypothetical protein